MSPVIVVRKGASLKQDRDGAGSDGEGLSSRDWVWVGLALVCTWLMLTGMHRLFGGNPAPPPPTPPAIVDAIKPFPPALEPEPPPRVFMMHDEAVRATVESLRQHAKECPDAPDVLSEEQIRDIERQGTLIL